MTWNLNLMAEFEYTNIWMQNWRSKFQPLFESPKFIFKFNFLQFSVSESCSAASLTPYKVLLPLFISPLCQSKYSWNLELGPHISKILNPTSNFLRLLTEWEKLRCVAIGISDLWGERSKLFSKKLKISQQPHQNFKCLLWHNKAKHNFLFWSQ